MAAYCVQVENALAKRKIVPARLARKLALMAGFRNLLVQAYMEIDRHRVYATLENDLGDFEAFVKAVSKLLRFLVDALRRRASLSGEPRRSAEASRHVSVTA